MKNYLIAATVFFAFGIAACSGGNNGTVKVDTIINPADATTTKQSDSTVPANAPGIDTIANGQSTSSGVKDSSKKKDQH